MKPLKKVGKTDPKGWQNPQDGSFPIIPEPDDNNELPVPYYDSDDYDDDDSEITHDESYGDTDTDYASDTSSISRQKHKVYVKPPLTSYKTVVKEELDFLDE
jgi:hypothetical protein